MVNEGPDVEDLARRFISGGRRVLSVPVGVVGIRELGNHVTQFNGSYVK